MQIRPHLPGYGLTRGFRNSAVRTGVYTGVALALAFTTWLFVADRLSAFESLPFERNLTAAVILGIVALVPILRFVRRPGHLLASSLIGWSILTLTYTGLCLHFHGLRDRITAPQVFILGAVVYMIFATLSWIATVILRARASHLSHSNHHLS